MLLLQPLSYLSNRLGGEGDVLLSSAAKEERGAGGDGVLGIVVKGGTGESEGGT